jgi:hypothetical protein
MTKQRIRRTSILPRLDWFVLLGLLGLVIITFVITWIASYDFLPGARLFPYFVAAIGGLVAVAAFVRVWMGFEPGSGPGQTIPTADDDAWAAYRTAALIVGSIGLYYAAIWLVGFLVATALYLVCFARAYQQSYVYAVLTACAALAFVFTINVTLDLHMPIGWLTRRLF